MKVPPLTWLYVPADRPDRVAKALASPAHAVIVDLEDAVKPQGKDAARRGLGAALGATERQNVFVRVNAAGTIWHEQDVQTVATLGTGMIVPKVENVAAVAGDGKVVCLIESALGVERAFEIAAHPRVAGIALGEADLAGETGAVGTGLDWSRARIVNAAAAAGLARPPQSVHPDVHDLDGLAASCARGRELGFLGRTAIHPAQLPVIEQAYLPTAGEVAQARALLETFAASAAGAYAVEGQFVDVAFTRPAETVVALADVYGIRA